MGSYCLVGRVSVWGDEKVLEMDSGDGCTTLLMYSKPLKMAKIVSFTLYTFCHSLKKSEGVGPVYLVALFLFTNTSEGCVTSRARALGGWLGDKECDQAEGRRTFSHFVTGKGLEVG